MKNVWRVMTNGDRCHDNMGVSEMEKVPKIKRTYWFEEPIDRDLIELSELSGQSKTSLVHLAVKHYKRSRELKQLIEERERSRETLRASQTSSLTDTHGTTVDIVREIHSPKRSSRQK